MSLLIALLAAARNLPWQAWAVAGVLLVAGLYGCHEYERGRGAAVSTITKANERAKEKADAAGKRVEDCVGMWDRSRGLCLPDGAGR